MLYLLTMLSVLTMLSILIIMTIMTVIRFQWVDHPNGGLLSMLPALHRGIIILGVCLSWRISKFLLPALFVRAATTNSRNVLLLCTIWICPTLEVKASRQFAVLLARPNWLPPEGKQTEFYNGHLPLSFPICQHRIPEEGIPLCLWISNDDNHLSTRCIRRVGGGVRVLSTMSTE